MAGVAVVFLILAVIFIVESTKTKEEALAEKAALEQKVGGQKEVVSATLASLHADLMQLDSQLDGGFIELNELPDGGVNALEIEFEKFHFELGRCATPQDKLETLRAGAPQLVDKICGAVYAIADAGAQPSIILEGHTDNVPFGFRSPECGVMRVEPGMEFDNNVRASSARAQSVFFSIRESLPDAGVLRECLENNFVVSGRGQAKPKVEPAKDSQNRRLVIRVRGDLDVSL